MIKLYFKQSLYQIRHNKLYSAIYLICTALAISMVLVIAVSFYARIANIYPETNRSRLMVIKSGILMSEQKNALNSSSLSLQCMEKFAQNSSAEAFCYVSGSYQTQVTADLSTQFTETILPVSTGFWTVFPYTFLSGKPFESIPAEAKIKPCVITDKLAHKLFGKEDVLSEQILIEYKPYVIEGVVKGGSRITNDSYADVFIPCEKLINESYFGLFGDGIIYILARSSSDFDQIRQETEQVTGQINSTLSDDYQFNLLDQPDTYPVSLFRYWSNVGPDMKKEIFRLMLIVVLLLFIPAINLSGMIASQMETRLAEIGIRKAFGAGKQKIYLQVFWENFFLTLWGSLLGLILSYILLFFFSTRILDLLGINGFEEMKFDYDLSVFLNPFIFGCVMLICILMNLSASLLPVFLAMRKSIVYSLNLSK